MPIAVATAKNMKSRMAITMPTPHSRFDAAPRRKPTTKPPPRNLNVVVGDCLHNLRGPLDNLAFERALAHTGEPLPSNIEGKSAFPIFRTRTDENVKKLNRMLRGVHPCAKALIEGLQPYERGDRFPNDPLWQLNQLSNEDKHRLPQVVLFAQMGMTYFVPGALLTEDIEPIFGNIERRAPIARYPAFDTTDAEVDVHGRPRTSVGFGQRSPRNLWGMAVPVRLSVISGYILTNVLRPLHPYLTEMSIVQVSQPYCLLRDKSLGI